MVFVCIFVLAAWADLSSYTGTSANAVLTSAQNPFECMAKLWTEYRINNWIQR